MKQIERLPAVVLCATLFTALLNPPPQRNSAAPDASPGAAGCKANQVSGAARVCLLPFVPARAASPVRLLK
jgi:hypothetical protein